MIVATAGHVDHGKTALVRALTGIDTDRLPEEKARGLSIDLGFAYQALDDGSPLGFVDVPGHEKFIRNMLAGVAGIDLGLLVVAADDGVMPQTREHLAILHLLGIERILVAITRIDRADAARLDAVREQLRQLLARHGRADAETLAVCAPRNQGIDALRQAIRRHADEVTQRGTDGGFRMAIDRVFTLRGIGLVVTGMVFAGEVRVDDRLLLSSDGSALRVRGIRTHDQASERACAGDRCALHVGGRGLDEHSLRRGDWLLHESLYAPTRRIDVELDVLESEPRALRHWTPVHLHLGAARIGARVAILEGGSLAAGDGGRAQLVLDQDGFALHGDRFVLRDQSARRSIAGGRVIDPFAPKRGRARPERLEILQAMSHATPETALTALVAASDAGVPLAPFALARNLPPARVDALVAALSLVRVGEASRERLFSATRWQRLQGEIEQAVADFHEALPDSPGASSQDLQHRLKPRLDIAAIDAATAALLQAGRLARRGARVHKPAHAIPVSEPDRQLWAFAAPHLAPPAGSPLSLHQAAEALGIDVRIMEQSLKRGVKAGVMLQLAPNRYAPSAYVAGLAREVEALAAESSGGAFGVAEYCKRSATGRNFAIDLLEYFDRVGFTARDGNQRRVRRAAATFFTETGD